MRALLCMAIVWALVAMAAQAQERDHSAHQAPAVHEEYAQVTPAPGRESVQDHSSHQAAESAIVPHVHDAAPVASTPRAEPVQAAEDAMQHARHMQRMMHGETLNYLLLGERLEYTESDGVSGYQWEAQAWVGYDRDRLWFKTEGHHDTDTGTTGRIEVQALYSRAIARFWDLQAGVRHDGGDRASRNHAVLGVQGLAPYWFEVDLAAFVSERGDVSARLEAEYELRFTQRLLLQPRLELNWQGGDDPAAGLGRGVSEASFGLRLRYEVLREFAPYVGVEWVRAYGGTADLLRRGGQEREEGRVVAGIRVWY